MLGGARPQGQPHGEQGAAFGSVGGLDSAVVRADDLLGNPQAQTAALGVGAEIRLENARQKRYRRRDRSSGGWL